MAKKNDSELKLGCIGKNPILKYKPELRRIKLTNLLKKILNPKTTFIDQKKAGAEFIQILRGSVYNPSEKQVSMIINLITEHPEVGLDDIMFISETF